jgi:hypothetical protein
VSGLDESLRAVLDVGGARTVALVDVGTGMIVAAAGDEPPELPAAAASLADEVRLTTHSLATPALATAALATPVLGTDMRAMDADEAAETNDAGEAGGDLDEILLTTASRLHLVKVLRRWQDEGLLLFVDLDRSRTNAALAVAQVTKTAPAILA